MAPMDQLAGQAAANVTQTARFTKGNGFGGGKKNVHVLSILQGQWDGPLARVDTNGPDIREPSRIDPIRVPQPAVAEKGLVTVNFK